MARQVRLEYPGAIYHVMARGNRREAIFLSDRDRKGFLDALDEACRRTGWRVHAYALMGNHYHLVLETPEANLVAGMSWLQNTYTRRFNTWHGLWGHLFGGRYKAVLVDDEERGYFCLLVDYVHLNPVRAGLVKLQEGLESYAWTSLCSGYTKPQRNRPEWMEVSRRLRIGGLEDKAVGRRQYLAGLEERVRLEGLAAGRTMPDGQSLQSSLARGWYFGSEVFREKMLEMGRKSLGTKARSGNYQSAPEVREHGLARARRLVELGLKLCGLVEAQLADLPCKDERKVLIALAVRAETTVALGWIAQQLRMGVASNVSREVKLMRKGMATNKRWRKICDEIARAS